MGRGENSEQAELFQLPENDPSSYPCPFCFSDDTYAAGFSQLCNACGERFDLDAIEPTAAAVERAQALEEFGLANYGHCASCKELFAGGFLKSVSSASGTSVSRYCPDCAPLAEAIENRDAPVQEVMFAGEVIAYVQELHERDEGWEGGDLNDRILAYDSYRFVEALSIAPFLCQWSYDDETVDQYALRSTPFPAIIVGAGDELIDGQHRVLAADARGDKTISAWVAIS